MASSFETKPKGHFIVLEGIDGSGTTTQARLLAERLCKDRRMQAWLTCEPTDGPIGKQIRKMLTKELALGSWRAEALLFAADRAEHVQRIHEVLKGGTHVVCDRYDLSNYTYQQLSRPDDRFYPAKDAGMDRQRLLRTLNEPNPRPDLTLVLDIPANVAELRRGKREAVPEIYDVPQLQRRLAGMYARAESLVPHDRVVHLDASRDIEAVHAAVWEAYEQHVRLLRIREAAS